MTDDNMIVNVRAAKIFIEGMQSLTVTEEACRRCSTDRNQVLMLQYHLNPRETQVFGDPQGIGCPLCCQEIVSRSQRSMYGS
jgi:hypothetical protein